MGNSLHAQGYETKFKATGFKPGDVYHTDEGVNVSLTGGGLEVEIPLGPALPGPIPLRPVVHYHGKYSQPLNSNWAYGQAFRDGFIGLGWTAGQVDAYEKAYKRWLPPNLPFGEAHPGQLIFRAGSTALGSSSPDLTLTSPFGKTTSYYLGMPGAYTYKSSNSGNSPHSDVATIGAVARTMAPEWDRTAAPMSGPGMDVLPGTTVSSSLGDSIGARLSGGTTLVFGPSVDRIFRRWSASVNPIISELLLVPHEILQVDRDFITLWRRSRNVYSREWDPKDVNGTSADYRWTQSVYHPVWIKTRSGFRADITIYRNTPGGHNGTLSDGGILTGYRVSINHGATWFQVGYASGVTSGPTVTFGGMDTNQADGASFGGFTPPSPGGTGLNPLYDFQPGTTIGYDSNYSSPFFWELEYTSASLGFGASSITYSGLTTAFEWRGPQGQLSRLTTPSGKTYTFTHELFRGVGTNPRSAAHGVNWLWNPDTPYALDYYSMVTRMDVQENLTGSVQTRSTTYRWKLPEVDPTSPWGTIRWISPTQGVAQTLPGGETILHVFCPPIDSDSSSIPLEPVGRTLLAARQAVSARYHYVPGDSSWESFFSRGADPATTTWYARERFEGWDLRSWERTIQTPHGANPVFLSTNTEPRPTRTIREEKAGPVEVTEQDDWNKALSQYEVKRTYVMAPGAAPLAQFWAPGALQGLNAPLSPGISTYLRPPGLAEPTPSGALAHQVTRTFFSSDTSAALLDREQKVETKVILAPATGATGFTRRVQNTFDSGARAHVVTQADQLDLLGGANALSLRFNQQPLGLFEVNQLLGVTLMSSLAGTELSGQVGAAYGYDATGRFMSSIQQSGANWSEQEPDHDNMGRPLTHKDPNGFSTRYAWDTLGRLTGIFPEPLESATAIRPENTLRRTTLTRGSQTLVYHYNGFGELIGEERAGPGGQVSHKVHGYDPGGRKTFETTWQQGPVSDFTEWARPKVGGNGITAWTYDGRGRVIRVVNANGEATDTDYLTPFRTQRKVYPDVAGVSTTAASLFDRDVLGRLVKVTDAAGQVTSYAYDAAGRIRRVQQGSQIRSWAYDLFGRLDTLIQPESGTTRYAAFTVTGKPTRVTYGYGSATPKTISTTFDALSRPLAVTGSDGSVDQAFVYDGAAAGGRSAFGHAMAQLSYSRDRSIELWYTYDGLNGRLGRLDTRVGDGAAPASPGQNFSQTFDYAEDGLRQSASVDGRTQRISLDPASRLPLGITHSRSDGYTLLVANFTQDGLLWAPTRIDYGNGAFTELGYRPDQTGLASLSHSLPGTVGLRAAWIYNYDGAGWLKGDGQDAYQYDPLGRLSQALVQRLNSPQVLTQKFGYDTVGNLLSSVTTPNTGALPSTLSNFAFPSDATELARRNQLPAGQTGAQYDPQGNLTYVWKTVSASGPFLQMTYDALGRVQAMYDSASGLKETYAYTPEGLRTRIDIFRGTALRKTRFKIYNDQHQMVSEYEIAQVEAPAAARAQLAATRDSQTRPAVPNARSLRSKSGRKAKVAHKDAMLLAEAIRSGRSKTPAGTPAVRYRNNDGTFPGPFPSLIDHNGPAGAYITYPIGAVTVSQGVAISFTGTTDFGADYTWDFGDGTPTAYGSFEPGSRTTTISHVFNTLSNPAFQVTYTVRNTAGGYTQSSAALGVTVVMPALPVIKAFTADGLKDTATAYWGDSALLAWDVTGATSLSIDQGVGTVSQALQGSVGVTNLQATTTYTLTATNAAGSVTQGVRIRVLPKIQSFSADANPIDAGTRTTLGWNIAGATAVSLQEGGDPPWDVTGTTTRPVNPLAPMLYVLTASNADGTSPSSSLRLNVTPVISTFSASPGTISPGQTTTLSWATVGTGLTLTMTPGIGLVTGTSQGVSPAASTIYTLTATNSYTSVSRSVAVNLNGLPTILSQPRNQSVVAGQAGTFSVDVSGPGPLSYQWVKNGVPVSGATGSSYTTSATVLADDGTTFTVMVANAYGSVLSQSATLSVAPDLVAPTVAATETGSSGIIALAATASDNVGVSRVEFHVDGVLEGAATASPYRIGLDSTTLNDGSHTLIAKAYDSAGNMGASTPVVFIIANATGVPPAIAAQPIDQVVMAGQMATFTVSAGGSGAPTYQWYFVPPGGASRMAITGATNATYTTPATTPTDSGTTYTVTITNAYGSVTSAPATLTVNPASQVGILVWKRDIVYVGTKEVGEIDADGLHITQVDHLGSPRLLSDRNGNLEDEQKYMPFGQYLDGQQKSRKGFTGHEQTDPSGLIYMQARFYAPMYGRFLSPDPARDQHFEETQSWNIYSYVQNNPTMKIDPTGMVGEEISMLMSALTWYLSKSSVSASHPATKGSGTYHPKHGMTLKEKRFSSPPPPSSPDHGLNPSGLKVSFDPGVVGNVGSHVPSILKTAAGEAGVTSIRFSSINDGKSHANNSKHYLGGNPGMDISVLNGLHVKPGSALVLSFQKAVDKAAGSASGQNFGPDYFTKNGKLFTPDEKTKNTHQNHIHLWIKKEEVKR
ncbi:MAG TPA: RHS repeat-associated core domain-containing protein [Geothrix sp.]